MTIVSLLVVLFLAWGEWADYRRIIIHPELVVDKGRGALRNRGNRAIEIQRLTLRQANGWRSIST